ncbi:MAG: hypothetical protein ACLQMS_00025 [Desulfomonilaceae bacterium]
MSLQVVMATRHIFKDKAMISINPKLHRIIFNKACRELMIENYKKEFEHVLLLRDPDIENTFWVRPCGPEEAGSRQLNKASGFTRSVSCSLLLNELNWSATKTETYLVLWDFQNNAAKVDLSQKVGEKKNVD